MNRVPQKITPNTIVEAILEIRFTTDFPSDAIFGILYNTFKNEYGRFEKLPIMELPSMVRDNDPNLKHAPNYKAVNGNYILQIGAKSFTISVVKEYEGWGVFNEKIKDTYNKVNDCSVIKDVERVGLRYINVLRNMNIFENSHLNANLKNNPLSVNTNVISDIKSEKGVCTLRANGAAEITLGAPNGEKVNGSMIDIDAVPDLKEFDDVFKAINYAHEIEKELFFSILKEDFISTLNPEY